MHSPLITRALIFLGNGVRVIKFLLSATASLILLITVGFLGTYFYFARDLPDIRTLDDYRPPLISEVYSSDGTSIAEFWSECRIFVPFDMIPKHVVWTFVAAEDARFFEHKGVDMRSIARAFMANLRAGEVTQGGSTITQQITRSLLLSRERKLSRKVKEAILATRLERYLDKEQILTLYLNQIFLGNRAYGVAAAARNYFQKELSDLTIAQAALLAGMPSAPTAFSPINNPRDARQKQLYVLRRMAEDGHISNAEAERAANETFTIHVAGTDKEFDDPDAAYFSEHVRRIVKEKYGDYFLYHKGLKIYTTVDIPMQRAASAAIRRGIESLDRRQGWRGPIENVGAGGIEEQSRLIAEEIAADRRIVKWPPSAAHSDVRTKIEQGRIYKAIVTGFSDRDALIRIGDLRGQIPHEGYKWAKSYSKFSFGVEGYNYVSSPERVFKTGDLVLVRQRDDGDFDLYQEPLIQSALSAIDPQSGFIKALVGGYDFYKSEFNRATQALRQPGSSFKPFIYAAALDKGYTFNTTIVDEPIIYKVGKSKTWSPKNYGGKFNGPTPFQNCLKFSRNIPTVKITYDIGTHYLTAYQRKMGITTPIDKYLSMALGANVVHLLEMTQAYAMFDNGGRKIRATAITRIEDSKGNIIESIDPSPEEAMKEAVYLPGQEDSEETAGRPAAERKGIDVSELNTELFEKAQVSVERDGLSLTDMEIKTLYGAEIPPDHVITPQTAYLMTQLLKSVVEGGTGTRVRALEKPAAGKTGTTNDETDAWFIGFVPNLAAGVWVGYDEIRKIAYGATGGTIASPIFLDFMKQATEDWEAADFKKPEGFPAGDIATLAGGSALLGSRPGIDALYSRGGADRAGEFFEEDFEDFGGDFSDHHAPDYQDIDY